MRVVAALCYAVCLLFCCGVAGAVIWIILCAVKPKREVWR